MDSNPPGSCPQNFPGKSTRVGCYFLLQGIFPAQRSDPRLLHWSADSLPLCCLGRYQVHSNTAKSQVPSRPQEPASFPCLLTLLFSVGFVLKQALHILEKSVTNSLEWSSSLAIPENRGASFSRILGKSLEGTDWLSCLTLSQLLGREPSLARTGHMPSQVSLACPNYRQKEEPGFPKERVGRQNVSLPTACVSPLPWLPSSQAHITRGTWNMGYLLISFSSCMAPIPDISFSPLVNPSIFYTEHLYSILSTLLRRTAGGD